MNVFGFSIGNKVKDSLGIRETFKTLKGRLTDLFNFL